MTDDLFNTYEEAATEAQRLTEATGEAHAVGYRPSGVMHYQVDRLPQVGDEVSRGFNGDYYPVGTIVSISKSMDKITTSTGDVFNRKRLKLTDRHNGMMHKQNRWTDGVFSLVQGHHNERNPSF